MKRVYICSPYRGNIEENTERARDYCLFAVKQGCNPICPHIFYTQFLDDSNELERTMGIAFGLDLVSIADELWVFGEPTEGMLKEIDFARDHNIMVKFYRRYK